MIVPHTRLLWLTGVAIIPLAAVSAVVPSAATAAVAVSLVLIAVAAFDAAVSAGRLTGINVRFPGVIRMTQNTDSMIPVEIRRNPPGRIRMRLALSVPAQLRPQVDVLTVQLTVDGNARIDWPCRPSRRGRVALREARCETLSRWTLWCIRSRVDASGEVRVYPNLRAEYRDQASLFLHRRQPGTHAVRRMGKGREFDMLRDYVHGDSYEDIHWRATAKRRQPVTKVYQVERTQEIYVVIDTSRLSGRSAEAEIEADSAQPASNLLDRYITSALVLQQIAQRQGDLFGLIAFNDRVRRFARARGGAAHYNTCVEALYTLDADPVTPDFEELFTFIRLRLRKRALLIFLTNLDDPVLTDTFARHVGIISRQHLVLVNTLTAPGIEPLFGPTPVTSTRDVYRQLARHLQWERQKELETILGRKDVRLHQLSIEETCGQVVDQYIRVKQRQLL